jgi:leader peptidase (prepilin peptidase)/N-methyltransferase
MQTALELILYIIIFMLGASVFSFLNVIVYRLPKGMNYISGRSACQSCGNELKWYHMIPVFSYLFLGGKCGFCKKKISFRYTLMELLGGALAVGTFRYYIGNQLINFEYSNLLKFLTAFAFICVLVTIAFIDMDTMEIPNGLVIFAAAFGLLSIFVFPEITLLDRAIGLFSVSVPFLLITLLIDGAFGGGDIKLMAATGIFLGWQLNLVALFLALLSGGGYAAYLLISKKKGRKEHFAFGPFLCAGVILSLFFGHTLLNCYLSLFFNA